MRASRTGLRGSAADNMPRKYPGFHQSGARLGRAVPDSLLSFARWLLAGSQTTGRYAPRSASATILTRWASAIAVREGLPLFSRAFAAGFGVAEQVAGDRQAEELFVGNSRVSRLLPACQPPETLQPPLVKAEHFLLIIIFDGFDALVGLGQSGGERCSRPNALLDFLTRRGRRQAENAARKVRIPAMPMKRDNLISVDSPRWGQVKKLYAPARSPREARCVSRASGQSQRLERRRFVVTGRTPKTLIMPCRPRQR